MENLKLVLAYSLRALARSIGVVCAVLAVWVLRDLYIRIDSMTIGDLIFKIIFAVILLIMAVFAMVGWSSDGHLKETRRRMRVPGAAPPQIPRPDLPAKPKSGTFRDPHQEGLELRRKREQEGATAVTRGRLATTGRSPVSSY